MSAPLKDVYNVLYRTWGPQHWWPGRTRFEIIVGAILTQNTAWTNVEKAIKVMRAERVLNPESIHRARNDQLARWIRSAGYFNVKARRVKAFVSMLYDEFGGSLNRLFNLPTEECRKKLLEVNGIGPETADSILLYAAGRPVFVVDAYTKRMLTRHGWLDQSGTYDEMAQLMKRELPESAELFNEFHALIVNLGKDYCRPRPRCEECPLRGFLPKGGPVQ